MDYATYSDDELRRFIASAPVPNEAANLEAIRRFLDQAEMFTQEEVDEEIENARETGRENAEIDEDDAYQRGYDDGHADGEKEGYKEGYAAAEEDFRESEE